MSLCLGISQALRDRSSTRIRHDLYTLRFHARPDPTMASGGFVHHRPARDPKRDTRLISRPHPFCPRHRPAFHFRASQLFSSCRFSLLPCDQQLATQTPVQTRGACGQSGYSRLLGFDVRCGGRNPADLSRPTARSRLASRSNVVVICQLSIKLIMTLTLWCLLGSPPSWFLHWGTTDYEIRPTWPRDELPPYVSICFHRGPHDSGSRRVDLTLDSPDWTGPGRLL